MIAVVQRVAEARVTAALEHGGTHFDAIGPGLVVLVCAVRGDTEAEAVWIADKLATLRIFQDDDGKMNRSALDIGGEALVVSQFTLAGELTKGTRPSFARAADPAIARPLIELIVARLREVHRLKVGVGVFGASMQLQLVNDGPVTIILQRDARTDGESG